MTKRKRDHLELALQSQTSLMMQDDRFDYEPMLSAHPGDILKPLDFGGKKMRVPIWISSMTGGSEYSGNINRNLARACNEFGMGMGLGSCRVLLEEGEYFDHFNLRDIIGDDCPFYANLGISQVEKYVLKKETGRIIEMIEKIKADGLIIHVNPIQEWLQPEGDKITVAPIETIKTFLEKTGIKLIVKEVGQGFGPESIKELLRLPLAAVELAAYGGTNFAKVELQRSNSIRQKLLEPLSLIGNNAYEMIDEINLFTIEHRNEVKCKSIIISGGLKNFLDGYYLINKCTLPSVYGQASAFLEYAREDYDHLREFIQLQIEGLKLASSYLKIKEQS
jgi:isopentenyl-diphosphate delta-isomerase